MRRKRMRKGNGGDGGRGGRDKAGRGEKLLTWLILNLM